MRHWTELTPEQAKQEFGHLPGALLNSDVSLPLNEEGEPCPFPYDPQQLVGAPIGQYHCPYCSAMVLAGIPHLDYSEDLPPAAEHADDQDHQQRDDDDRDD